VSELWPTLLRIAREEVTAAIARLPDDLRPHAESLAVTYEAWPSPELILQEEDDGLLGLFVGDPLEVGFQDASPTARQIILFLENLWVFADEDEEIYREEVWVTYIHEFGHYLGLEEDELEERGLL
jgi:predicted Zn-dependent protease with MMP-like domain